jgi:hypothetical protein
MTACACGASNPQAVVTLTTDERGDGNVHEKMCDLCLSRWESSVNYRLAMQHVKEGREGASLSELRSWQAVHQRRAE